jgi:outer membrane protein assembly factor BamD (BamD/ComL family)
MGSPGRSLLRQARRHLRDGRPRAALALLTRHQRRWPHGALEQEREVLAVEALAASGDDRAARDRATLFLRRHPGSALGPAALRPIDGRPR